MGGAAGLPLEMETVSTGLTATRFAPSFIGVTLLGRAAGGALGANFGDINTRLEGTAYLAHLHGGGALLAVYSEDKKQANHAR